MNKICMLDIWQVNFDPSVGKEIQKTRPALVLSNNYYNLASGTIFVVPLTSQIPKNIANPFYVSIEKNKTNKLSQNSFANVSQLRSVSKLRFIKKTGIVSLKQKEEILKRFLEITDTNILDLRYL